MEGFLRSISTAGYRQLQGRSVTVFRYDSLSDSFPDEWRLAGGEVSRWYATHLRPQPMIDLMRSTEPLVVNDLTRGGPELACLSTDVEAYVAAPVAVDGVPWGVLFVCSPMPDGFCEDDAAFVQSLARQIGSVSQDSTPGSSGNVELSTVRVLAATVDAKDHYTRHHSTNVSFYARLLAREMNLDPAEVRRIELAGLLHDIGKIAIPDQILQNPNPLTPEERLLIQTHAAIGGNILSQASHLQHLVPLVRHHHERNDGTGYPDQLKGREVPLGAAILNLADSFDTMTTRRIYRMPMTLDEAMVEIQRCRGKQFHPDVVDAMLKLVGKARLTRQSWLLSLGSAQEGPVLLPDPEADTWQGALDGDGIGQLRDPLDFLVQVRQVQQFKELTPILQMGGEHALGFWSADAVLFYLLDRLSGMLRLTWSAGSSGAERLLTACRAEGAVAMTRGLLGWASLTNQGICVADARRDPRWPFSNTIAGPASLLVAPVAANGTALGVIQLVSCGESRFSQSDVKVMKIFSALLGQAIDRVVREQENREASSTDPLTGIRNVIYLQEFLDQVERGGVPDSYSVAFLDGDDLKDINDRYGHEAGDMVIRHIARCLVAWQRPGDVVVRCGGDEFLVFFRGLTLPEASARLERMRMTIAETPVEMPDGNRTVVSVSCGVTEVDLVGGPHTAVRAAEQAMHNAKRSGKNRVWTVAG